MAAGSRSQIGGESNWRGMRYQKRFAALLCCNMLCGENIARVTCEHQNDIEVEKDSKLIYYQIKISKGSLARSGIRDSFALFLENSVHNQSTDKEYILVSNNKIGDFTEP